MPTRETPPAVCNVKASLFNVDARVATKINATSINELSDVVITTGTAGQMIYYNGTNWINSDTVDSANINRFSRTNAGTASNAVLEISRNRGDAARAADNGPWLGFAYVGTDNTQATAPQSAIRSMYDTGGNHKLQVLQLPGNYSSPVVVGQIQRGNTFFNTTGGVPNLFLSDSTARIGGTTTTITNSANTSTYASFSASGTTITTSGILNVIRTSAVAATPAGEILRLSRTDVAGPQDSDGIDFRLSVGGTSTNSNFARFDGVYKSSGLNEIGMSVSTDSFSANTNRIYVGTRESTKIQCTPAGGGSIGTTAEFTQLATTLKSDAFTLQTAGGVSLVGNKINYNRVYGQFEYNTTITPAAINTAYVFPLGTTAVSNIASVGSTSRLIPGAAGAYNLQFSVQVANADNGSDHIAYIWLRKNGVDVSGSTGRITVFKGGATIAGWNYLISSANTTDYWEIAYAVDDLNITFPFYSSTAFAPSTATLITTLTPVGA